MSALYYKNLAALNKTSVAHFLSTLCGRGDCSTANSLDRQAQFLDFMDWDVADLNPGVRTCPPAVASGESSTCPPVPKCEVNKGENIATGLSIVFYALASLLIFILIIDRIFNGFRRGPGSQHRNIIQFKKIFCKFLCLFCIFIADFNNFVLFLYFNNFVLFLYRFF